MDMKLSSTTGTVITWVTVHHPMLHTKAARKGRKFIQKPTYFELMNVTFRIWSKRNRNPDESFSFQSSHNDITPEEEARRHQEGVDAFLSFATEVSTMSSPLKRPPSVDYVENVPAHNYNNNHLFVNGNGNGNYYYNGSSSPLNQTFGQPHIYSYMSSPSPPKKSRTRTLRTKLKKKTWLR